MLPVLRDGTHVSLQFNGAEFLLNDCNSAVLSHNILFILLYLQLPKNTEENKEWLNVMWAVWHCHKLCSQHPNNYIKDCLKSLLKQSESCGAWSHVSKPLHNLVHFTSPDVLAERNFLLEDQFFLRVHVFCKEVSL